MQSGFLMYRTEKLRGYVFIRNRYVLRLANTLMWFWVVWTGPGELLRV
jgi:hypothetical protein